MNWLDSKLVGYAFWRKWRGIPEPLASPFDAIQFVGGNACCKAHFSNARAEGGPELGSRSESTNPYLGKVNQSVRPLEGGDG